MQLLTNGLAAHLHLHLMLLPCLPQLLLHHLQPPLQPHLVTLQLLCAAGSTGGSSGNRCSCL
jgi:hypothetical protein